MVQSNTKHTDLDRIDTKEKELRWKWTEKIHLGEDNVYTKEREIIQINIVTL
jgi:hypothetical protein